MIRFLYIILCLSIVSCRGAEEEDTRVFDNLWLSSIKEQHVQARIWRDVSAHELFTLPREPDVLLYNPGDINVDASGHIFVSDYGVMQVVAFAPDGQYVASYGEGTGEGPGELKSILDMGSASDSVVYVVDHAARAIHYFVKYNGTFIESRAIEGVPKRSAVTESGVEFTLLGSSDSLFRSRKGSDITLFGNLVEDQSSYGSDLAIGFVATYRDKMVLGFTFFPAIAQYDPDGSIVYARTTPDHNAQFEEPEWERTDYNGRALGFRIDGERFNGNMGVYNDQLFVYARQEGAIDVYDAATGNYEYSFRLSHNEYNTFVSHDRLYQEVNDTTIVVYSLDL